MKWVLVAGVVMACGGAHSAAIDAAADGIVSDGTIADSARVDVTVLSSGAPDPTAIAVFMDPTGVAVQDGMVDASGNAHCDLPQGGSVTVLQVIAITGNHHETITTIRGVKPLDHLRVGSPRSPTSQSGATDTMTATDSLAANSTPYFFMSCGSGESSNGTTTLTFYASCEQPTFDLLTLADVPSLPRQYVWQPGLAHASNGSVAISDSWQPMSHVTATISNIPTNVGILDTTLDTFVGAVPFQMDQRSIQTPPAGTNSVSLLYPPGAGNGTLLTVQVSQGIETPDLFAAFAAAATGTMSLDFAALPLPTVTGGIVQSQTGATWTQTDGGAADARLVLWQAQWDDLQSIHHDVFWIVVEDPREGGTSTVLPSLPAAYRADDPTQQDNLVLPHPGPGGEGVEVEYVDFDVIPDYDGARQYGSQLDDVTAPFLTGDHVGHIRFSL